jgi:hypothetical protein
MQTRSLFRTIEEVVQEIGVAENGEPLQEGHELQVFLFTITNTDKVNVKKLARLEKRSTGCNLKRKWQNLNFGALPTKTEL